LPERRHCGQGAQKSGDFMAAFVTQMTAGAVKAADGEAPTGGRGCS